MANILVTGGAGFIGSALIRHIIKKTNHTVLNIDKLTYASSLDSLKEVDQSPRYNFKKLDICNSDNVKKVFIEFKPEKVFHLAAESHVDRSISDPINFINTNIIGTYSMLNAAVHYWESLKKDHSSNFIFHHISTDEVYGDLNNKDELFKETTPYNPSSPYSASKASSDHLVRAWNRTYGLPTIITNCSNNYGPYQFPEKLIPCVILNALQGKPIQIYGSGEQIRDWLYVEDHIKALMNVAFNSLPAETYNIGGHNEVTNIQVIGLICEFLEEFNTRKIKRKDLACYSDLIVHVKDRPGHDQRYAIDSSKIKSDINWSPKETFETGLRKTVQWYLNNYDWLLKMQSKKNSDNMENLENEN